MNLFDIVQTIFNFFSMLYIYRFMTAFFDKAEKRNNKWLFCLYFIYPVITSVVYFKFNYPMVNFFVNLFLLFIISLQYRAKLAQRIIAVGLIFFIMGSTESVCAAATGYIGRSAYEEGTYSNIAGIVMYNLLIFAVSLIIYNLKNMKKAITIPKSLWLAIAGIPILSFVAISQTMQKGSSQTQVILTIIIFLCINGFVFFLYDQLILSYDLKLRSALLEEEKECYYNQCQYMQQSEQELSAFRHDIRNQLDMIYELIEQESMENVKSCAKKIEQKLDNNNTFSKTGNIALDSILNLKLLQAKQKGITVLCESDIPKDLQLDASDLMVILGNLLDNAVTAAEKVRENAFIKICIIYEKGMLFIAIKNSYSETLIETNGYLYTTKKNKEHHGYGIKNVKKILESYNGMIEYHYDNEVFCTDVALYCGTGEL